MYAAEGKTQLPAVTKPLPLAVSKPQQKTAQQRSVAHNQQDSVILQTPTNQDKRIGKRIVISKTTEFSKKADKVPTANDGENRYLHDSDADSGSDSDEQIGVDPHAPDSQESQDSEVENQLEFGTADRETQKKKRQPKAKNPVTPQLKWSEDPAIPHMFPFRETPGVTVDMGTNATPLDFFELFFDEEILNMIVIETNRYADEIMEKYAKTPGSRLNNWNDVVADDIKTFMAILIHMGIVRKSETVDYWSTDPVLKTTIFGEQMSRDRFQEILSMIHFNFNSADDMSDPLFKLRPLLDQLVSKMQKFYCPAREISIDESMVHWRGRWKYR